MGLLALVLLLTLGGVAGDEVARLRGRALGGTNSSLQTLGWRLLTTDEKEQLRLMRDEEWTDTSKQAHSDFKARFRAERRVCVRDPLDLACTTKPITGVGNPTAIVVLGPSAAGKTAALVKYLSVILQTNYKPTNLAFFPIDGGKMRESSFSWAEMKRRCAQGTGNDNGCSDGFKFFKSSIDTFKDEIFGEIIQARENLLLVDTATMPIFDYLWWSKNIAPLQGYDIIFTGIYASKAVCTAAGTSRAIDEGKVYSNKWWQRGVTKMYDLMNYAREQGNKATFVLVRNNWNKAWWPSSWVEGLDRHSQVLKDCYDTNEFMNDFRCPKGVRFFTCSLQSNLQKDLKAGPLGCWMNPAWRTDDGDVLFPFEEKPTSLREPPIPWAKFPWGVGAQFSTVDEVSAEKLGQIDPFP